MAAAHLRRSGRVRGGLYHALMDTVVDLLQWRRTRGTDATDELQRLEGAIHRLDAVASAALAERGELEPWVETELLAIMGALSMDLFDDAAERAERIAERLSSPASSATK
jgi:hypothetical protein